MDCGNEITGEIASTARATAGWSRRGILKAGLGVGAGAVGIASLTAPRARAQETVAGDLTMWVYPLLEGVEGGDEGMWAGIVERFVAANPEVSVTVQVQPWSRRVEQLTTAMAAGVGPDVWYINIEDIPNHARSGRLVSFEEILPAETKEDYLPAASAAMSYDGTLWAAPILMGATTTFYNTNVFEAAGVSEYPTTWDEMRELGPIFKEQGFYLTQYDAGNAQAFFYPLLWQAGGRPYNDDGAIAFNSPEGVEALSFVVELFEQEWAPANAATAENIPITETPLGLGEVAVGLPGSESPDLRMLSEVWGEGALRIGEPLMYKEQAAFGTVAGYTISEQSENKEAAAAWVRFITDPETMTEICGQSGFFVPRASIGKIHGDDPILSEVEDQLAFVRATPAVLGGRQVLTDALTPEIQAAVLGQKTPQQALDDAAALATSILAEASAQ